MTHCCPEMTRQLQHVCEQHADPFECPDALIDHSAQTGEYGIIVHDGGSSCVVIKYCPWCGAKLPLAESDH